MKCIKSNISSPLREVIVPPYSALMQPHLECFMQLWAPQHKKDKALESVQRQAMKMVKSLEGKMYEMAEITWIVQPGEEDTEERHHHGFQLPHKESRGAGDELFFLVTTDKTRGNSLKL